MSDQAFSWYGIVFVFVVSVGTIGCIQLANQIGKLELDTTKNIDTLDPVEGINY